LLTEGDNEVNIVNKAIETVQEHKIDNNFSKNNIENEKVDENAIITENISNISSKTKRIASPKLQDKFVEFTLESLMSLFSNKEIKKGIFGNDNNTTTSPTRQVFDLEKTKMLKGIIVYNFN